MELSAINKNISKFIQHYIQIKTQGHTLLRLLIGYTNIYIALKLYLLVGGKPMPATKKTTEVKNALKDKLQLKKNNNKKEEKTVSTLNKLGLLKMDFLAKLRIIVILVFMMMTLAIILLFVNLWMVAAFLALLSYFSMFIMMYELIRVK